MCATSAPYTASTSRQFLAVSSASRRHLCRFSLLETWCRTCPEKPQGNTLINSVAQVFAQQLDITAYEALNATGQAHETPNVCDLPNPFCNLRPGCLSVPCLGMAKGEASLSALPHLPTGDPDQAYSPMGPDSRPQRSSSCLSLISTAGVCCQLTSSNTPDGWGLTNYCCFAQFFTLAGTCNSLQLRDNLMLHPFHSR